MTKPRGRAETAVARSYVAKEKGEAELTVYCKALKESRSSGLESKVCGMYVRTYVNFIFSSILARDHRRKVERTLKRIRTYVIKSASNCVGQRAYLFLIHHHQHYSDQ